MVRDSGHVVAWTPSRRTPPPPGARTAVRNASHPGPAAKAAAAQLLQIKQRPTAVTESVIASTDSTAIDLSAYERAAQNRTIE